MDPTPRSFLPTPRVLGRSLRILVGAVLLLSFAQVLLHAPQLLAAHSGWSIPGGSWWVIAVLCFLALPMLIDSGFGSRMGRWAQLVVQFLLVAFAAGDRAADARLWALPLAVLVLLLMLYVLAHAGVSFLAAGIAATPG